MSASLFGFTSSLTTGTQLYSVDTIAALRAVPKGGLDAIEVLGYYAVGDGGGGTYWYDSADTSTADNGGTIIVAADSGRWKLVSNGSVSFRQFGAKGDGVTNDRDVIRNAIAWQKLTGEKLYGEPADNHFLGGFPTGSTEYKFTIDYDNWWIEPNNCLFSAISNTGASDSNGQVIFAVLGGANGYFGKARFAGTAVARPPSQQKGIKAFSLYSRAAGPSIRNIAVDSISCDLCETAMSVVTDDPVLYRAIGIKIGTIYSTRGYYGLNCANNGDNLFAGLITTDDIVRSYFVYGVDNHDVRVRSTNHFEFMDILIKCYNITTKNIKVLYTSVGDISTLASIALEHENDSNDTVLENIYITANIQKSNAANPSVTLAAYTLAGATRATTNCQWKNIRIEGTTNSITPVQMLSAIAAGNNPSRLFLSKSFSKSLGDYKRFLLADGEFACYAASDAAGGMTIELNVAEWRLLPVMGRLTVWAANDTASAANYIMREYWVGFSVASTGNVTLTAATTISTETQDPGAFGPTIAVAAGGAGSYDLVITCANYTGANRLCKARFQPMSYNQ